MGAGRRFSVAAFVAILIAVGLAYGNALGNDFAYDDHDLITGNQYLIGWMADAPGSDGRPIDYLSTMLTSDFARLVNRFEEDALRNQRIGYYRPVILSSYLIDTWFFMDVPAWGSAEAPKERTKLAWRTMRPAGFHLTNLLFHALNALLVFSLARSLWRNRRLALAAGLVFAVHPITTESVAWISGRTDVIATTAFLGAFWGYVRFRRGGSRLAIGTAVALFVVATFAKEIVATLPLLLAGWELARPRRTGAAPEAWGRRLVWPAVFALAVLPYFLVKSACSAGGGPQPAAADPWFGIAWVDVAFTLPRAFAWYWGRLVAPIQNDLYPILPFVSPSDVAGWIGYAALHVALLGGAAWALLRSPALRIPAMCIVAIFIVLQPLNCLVPGLRLIRFPDVGFPVSERFLYLPTIFFALALGWGLSRLRGRVGAVAASVGLSLVVAVAAWRTIDRNRDWRDNFALFEATVASSPNSVRMRLNYGAALIYDVWRVEEGMHHLMHAVRYSHEVLKQPPVLNLFLNLAHANFVRGDFDQMAKDESAVVRASPGASTANNGAVALVSVAYVTGDPDYFQQAIGHYDRALRFSPNYPGARQSKQFVQQTAAIWNAYRQATTPGDDLAAVFGNGFLVAAQGLAADASGEAWRRAKRGWQALLVIDAAIMRLPRGEGLAAMPKTSGIVDGLRALGGDLLGGLEPLCEELRRRWPDSVDLRYLAADLDRLAANLRDEQDRIGAAVAGYAEVVKRDADHAGAALGLARLGDPQAQASLDRAVDAMLEPDETWEGRPVDASPDRAIAMARLVARSDERWSPWLASVWERVLEAVRRDAERDRSWGAWNRLGVMLGRAGADLVRPRFFEEGVAALRRAREMAPREPAPLINLVRLLPRIGRHGEAKQLERELRQLSGPRPR